MFNNGSLVLAGCLSLDDEIKATNIIKSKLNDDTHSDVKICLINAAIRVSYSINLVNLVRWISQHPKIIMCNYDNNKYSGVVITYRGSEWGYFDNTKHFFFRLHNIKQLIFSHFNTNIKKFTVTLYFFAHYQTTPLEEMLGL